MPATAILNPYANRWETGRRASEVEAILRQAGIDFVMKVTDRPNHGIELASEAVKERNTELVRDIFSNSKVSNLKDILP